MSPLELASDANLPVTLASPPLLLSESTEGRHKCARAVDHDRDISLSAVYGFLRCGFSADSGFAIASANSSYTTSHPLRFAERGRTRTRLLVAVSTMFARGSSGALTNRLDPDDSWGLLKQRPYRAPKTRCPASRCCRVRVHIWRMNFATDGRLARGMSCQVQRTDDRADGFEMRHWGQWLELPRSI